MYVQSDPIGLAGGINTFGYAYQNPIVNFDPDGRLVWFGIPAAYWLAGGAAVGGGYVIGQQLANGSSNTTYSPSTFGDDAGDQENSSDVPNTGLENACPPNPGNQDRCRGLRRQLQQHQDKLSEYMANPLAGDNNGFLAQALQSGNDALYNQIVNSRISSLERQINNFRRQLQQCESMHGGG